MRMPNLTLPPPAAAAPLDEGQALGVWRLEKPLPLPESISRPVLRRGGGPLPAGAAGKPMEKA